MFFKLICYINTTKNNVFMAGFIGDNLDRCELRLYTYADLAGCKFSKKSASCVCMA